MLLKESSFEKSKYMVVQLKMNNAGLTGIGDSRGAPAGNPAPPPLVSNKLAPYTEIYGGSPD